jgi:hypothetical protein
MNRHHVPVTIASQATNEAERRQTLGWIAGRDAGQRVGRVNAGLGIVCRQPMGTIRHGVAGIVVVDGSSERG